MKSFPSHAMPHGRVAVVGAGMALEDGFRHARPLLAPTGSAE